MSTVRKISLAVFTVMVAGRGHDAHAQSVRNSFPIVAGTKLWYSNPTHYCTAGLVLQQTGFFRRITNYQRALRFVLTAGHCGNLNDLVKVGSFDAGMVVWKSSRFDLEVVRIEPTATRRAVCSAPSTGVHCTIAHDYTPRAAGQVILGSLRTRNEGPVPVIGTGTPGNTETFCTSGATTGVMCNFIMQHPPGWLHPSLNNNPYDYAQTTGANAQSGDSGGPVVSESGIIYGIIAQGGKTGTQYANILRYIDIAKFFAEQPAYSVVYERFQGPSFPG